MTDAPANDTRDTLYITDAELIRRMGVPEKIARQTLHMLDRDRSRGFPQKNAIWGDRRYWPAVKAWLDKSHGLNMDTPQRRTA